MAKYLDESTDDEDYYYDEAEELQNDDVWPVVSAYFEEKGLVRQQLDSFNEFIQDTMQKIVDESGEIEVKPESQHQAGQVLESENVSSCSSFLALLYSEIVFNSFVQLTYRIKFSQIYLSKPTTTEADGEMVTLYPKAARIRGLTYSAPLYTDVVKTITKKNQDGVEEVQEDYQEKVFMGKVTKAS